MLYLQITTPCEVYPAIVPVYVIYDGYSLRSFFRDLAIYTVMV